MRQGYSNSTSNLHLYFHDGFSVVDEKWSGPEKGPMGQWEGQWLCLCSRTSNGVAVHALVPSLLPFPLAVDIYPYL